MNLRRTANLALGLLATTALAQVGEPPPRSFLLDKSYGENGGADLRWRLPGNEVVAASVPRSDGKIWVIGYGASFNGERVSFISRVLPSGQMDPSFGNGGRIEVPSRYDGRTANIDKNGRLVTVWSEGHYRSAVMVRTLEDGTPDPSFGTAIEGFSWKGVRVAYDRGSQRSQNIRFADDGGIWYSAGDSCYRVSEDGSSVVASFKFHLSWAYRSYSDVTTAGKLAVVPHGNGLFRPFITPEGDLGLTRFRLSESGLPMGADPLFAGDDAENIIRPRTGIEHHYLYDPEGADVVVVDGKILVLWLTPRDIRNIGVLRLAVLARLSMNGELDPTFGNGGFIEASLPYSATYASVRSVRLLAPSADGPFHICGPDLHTLTADGGRVSAVQDSFVSPYPLRDPLMYPSISNFEGMWLDPLSGQLSGIFPRSTELSQPGSCFLHRFQTDLTSSSQQVTFEVSTNTNLTTPNYRNPDFFEVSESGECYVRLLNSFEKLPNVYANDGVTVVGSSGARILRLRSDGMLDTTWGRLGHVDVVGMDAVKDMAPSADGGLWCLTKGNIAFKFSRAGVVETRMLLPNGASAPYRVTDYQRILATPEGSAICLGVHYAVRRHLVAHRVMPSGKVDQAYGGTIGEITSIFGDSPQSWIIGDPVALQTGGIRFSGTAGYGIDSSLPSPRRARMSQQFSQIIQLNKHGKRDGGFGRGGLMHLPGIETGYTVSMTSPNTEGGFFATWNILPRDKNRQDLVRHVSFGLRPNGSLFAIPGASGLRWMPGALTLLQDGTLAQFDLNAAKVRFFDPSGRPWAGNAGLATIDLSPGFSWYSSFKLLPTGDFLQAQMDGRKNKMYRFTLGSVAVTPQTRRPIFNRATGFHEQTLDITNNRSADLTGFRLLMSNITPGVHLWNASTAVAYPNQPVVEYLKPLAKGESITMTLQFTGGTRLAPRFHSTMVGSETVSAGAILKIERNPGKVSLVFASLPGSRYAPDYSDDNGLTWKTAAKAILAAGTRTAWVDKGKPQTTSRPTEARMYRFVSVVE